MVDNGPALSKLRTMAATKTKPCSPSRSPKEGPLSWIEEDLVELERQGLLRTLSTMGGRRPGEIQVDRRWLPNFSGNDYLGLSTHPSCIAAAPRWAELGCGATASRVVSGGIPPHGELETRLRQIMKTPASLVFPSGYQANVGAISALLSPGDLVFSDAENHASIVDGCRLSGADIRVYPHLRWDLLEAELRAAHALPGRRMIVSDTVFSMDGSLAPVVQLARLAKEYDALFLADEAHAMGVIGPKGRGLCADRQVVADVLIGTFSKGLGSHGAFSASVEPIAQRFVNRARALMYTTALPPTVLGASLAALDVAASAEGDSLRRRVLSLADGLRNNLREQCHEPTGDGTPIVSLQFPSAGRATEVSRRLLDEGHLVWAFRPPTVPHSTSRLRVSLSAAHTDHQLERLTTALLAAL
jgi:8-amino-7-oxononanoate synthase